MKSARNFIILFIFVFGLTIAYMGGMMVGDNGQPVEVEVTAGQSVKAVAGTLKDHGLIRSSFFFRRSLTKQGLDTAIKPGRFMIPRGATYSEIGQILSSPPEINQLSVTIPEGYTIPQIDDLLAKKKLIAPGELMACIEHCDFSSFDFLPEDVPQSPTGRLEGYLFPDTYYTDPDEFVVKFFIERLLGTFRKRVIVGLADELVASDRSLHEVVTMGSLIERETRTNDERPMISGILWKRFDANQGLAVDATIRYALDKPTGPLTKVELQTDTPYNTRKYVGLPPGPIASAGLASIRAALEPKESEYWYYLHGKDGQIRYAQTNDEHNVNKAKYLR